MARGPHVVTTRMEANRVINGDGLCLAALRIVLGEMGSERERWLPSTRELRQVSFHVCNSCRRACVFRVWVGQKTPRSLWIAGHRGLAGGAKLVARRRVLGVRAAAVVWDRSVEDLPAARKFLENVVRLKFSFHFDEPLGGVCSWPESLVVLDLGVRFKQDVSQVAWPPALRELKFGSSFDRHIKEVAWPPRLLRLTFGAGFNKPIDGVVWPASLRTLEFGQKFDQPVRVNEVSWPARLETLIFGRDFSQELGGAGTAAVVVKSWWPDSLRRLTLSEGFRQPIDRVAWPAGLEELSLDRVGVGGSGALRGCNSVDWSPGLQRLSIDLELHQPLRDVPLPRTLIELVFGGGFNQAVVGVRWPRGLKRLVFGASFDRSVEHAGFPPGLEHLTFGHRFNQGVSNVRWPLGMKIVVFGDHFDQPVGGFTIWPNGLRALEFGRSFNQSFEGVSWPSSLAKLVLGKMYDQPVSSLRLPPGLVELHLAEGCRQALEGVMWPVGLKMISVGRGVEVTAAGGLELPKGCRVQRR